mmetsp:Transcript_15129/g.24256  ORF Transcript_15129/g.24256 Transcript_15129/m.24256 type:complete len:203 (-) Transcript_15129:36-644(-)
MYSPAPDGITVNLVSSDDSDRMPPPLVGFLPDSPHHRPLSTDPGSTSDVLTASGLWFMAADPALPPALRRQATTVAVTALQARTPRLADVLKLWAALPSTPPPPIPDTRVCAGACDDTMPLVMMLATLLVLHTLPDYNLQLYVRPTVTFPWSRRGPTPGTVRVIVSHLRLQTFTPGPRLASPQSSWLHPRNSFHSSRTLSPT